MASTIRAYHFLPSHHALDDLRRRRLKIARIDDLNDPFDLWAVAQPNHKLRSAIRKTKDQLAQKFGMVCFSLSWQNPLLWSHYAERHQGVALGFDINKGKIKKVSYVKKRPTLQTANLQVVHHLLYTKYVDWQYEQEVRVFTSLEDKDSESGLYFADFGDDCVLREVIVGPLGHITENDLLDALREDMGQVACTKARLAFNSFKVVKNKIGFQ
jgi:hypothetical protein